MARWYVDIEKRLSSEFWSNRYVVEDGGIPADVADYAEALMEYERAFHAQVVTFTRYRYSSATPGDGVYTIVPVNQPGVRNTPSVLPLFNTLRVDIQASVGRPSRKYYRGVLGEGDINGDAVDTSTFTVVVDTALTAYLSGTGGFLVDPGGTGLVSVTIHPFVQMRQLRRSRRRRENGGGIFQ